MEKDDHTLASISPSDLTKEPAKDPSRPDAPRTNGEVLFEVKLRLVQEALISGRGFLY